MILLVYNQNFHCNTVSKTCPEVKKTASWERNFVYVKSIPFFIQLLLNWSIMIDLLNKETSKKSAFLLLD